MDEWKRKNEEQQRQMLEEYRESILTCSREDSSLKKVKHSASSNKRLNRKAKVTTANNCDSAGDSNSEDDERPLRRGGGGRVNRGRGGRKFVRGKGSGGKRTATNSPPLHNGIKGGDASRPMFVKNSPRARSNQVDQQQSQANSFRSPRLNNRNCKAKLDVRRSPRTKFETPDSGCSRPRRSSVRLFNH